MIKAQMPLCVSRFHGRCFSNGVRVCPFGIQRAGAVSPGRGQCTPELSSLDGMLASSELRAGAPFSGQRVPAPLLAALESRSRPRAAPGSCLVRLCAPRGLILPVAGFRGFLFLVILLW